MKTGSNRIDIVIGARVKARRKELGITQEMLGIATGRSFQQIQKYERGQNRISASLLWLIGKILGVPVSYFFDGLE
ncbi:MAG: hypothetical protein Kilf2KO_28570 [Rhodospirillales bacterium]